MLAEEVRRNRDIYKRASAISKNGSISSSLLEGSIDVMKTQLLSSASNWSTDSSGNIIFTSLDGNSAMLLAGNGFMIANSKLENGDWNWRTFGTGDGFAADLITTGFLSAERIAANSITVNKLSSDVGESLDLSSNKSIDLRVTTLVESQIGKLMNVVHVGEEPLEPTVDMIWLDTTVEPNIFKRWTGEEWAVVNDISELAQKINSAELKIDAHDASINAMVESMDIISDRVEAAELKITPEAITQVVRDSDTYKEDLASATMTADKFETFVSGSQGISTISQKANEIDLLIESDSSSTEVKFTDAAIKAITDRIDISASEELQITIGELQEQIDSAETKIQANTEAIALKASEQDVGILKEKMAEAEEKITPEAIVQTVRTSQGYTEDLEELSNRITVTESSIEQQSDEIALRVTKEEYSIIENKVVEQQSQIVQHADSITLLAGRMDDVEVEVEDTSIHEGATPPEAPLNEGKIWLDSSVNPPIFRRWLGLDVPTDRYYSVTEGGSIVQTPSQFDNIVSASTEFFLMQDGIGDPYPVGGGKNKFCVVNKKITDLNGLIVTATVGSSELNFNGTVAGSNVGATVATSTEIPAGTYTISVHGLKNGDYMNGIALGSPAGTYLFLNLTDNAPKTFTVDVPTVLKISCIGIANKTAYNNETVKLQIEVGSSASEYAPCSNIRPITGWNSLNLNHSGKNLLMLPYVDGDVGGARKHNGITFTVNADGSITANGTVTNATAYFRLNNIDLESDASIHENGASGKYVLSGKVRYNANTKYCTINLSVGTTWDNVTFCPQVELGTVATEFEPPKSELHTAQFGQTVCGGRYDWLTGDLTAEWAIYTVTGNETWRYHETLQRWETGSMNVGNTCTGDASGCLDVVCSHSKTAKAANNPGVWVYSSSDSTIALRWMMENNPFADADELKAWLADQYAAGTPVQFAYKLAVPIEIQLDPQVIVPFDGVNTFYGDGEVSVTYDGTGWETVNDTRELEESISKTVTKTELQHIIRIESDGLHVGAQGSQSEAIIDNDSFDIAFGGQIFSSFAGNYVEFGNYQIRRTADGGLAFKLR